MKVGEKKVNAVENSVAFTFLIKKTFDFLFGRKFLMKGIPTSSAFELIVNTNAPARGFKQHLVVAAELADGSGWYALNNHPTEVLQTIAKIYPGSPEDMNVTSDDVVNTRLAVFLVTEVDKDPIKPQFPWPCDPEEGCNSGLPAVAALLIAGFMLRRKY
jgi:hypothetical protein